MNAIATAVRGVAIAPPVGSGTAAEIIRAGDTGNVLARIRSTDLAPPVVDERLRAMSRDRRANASVVADHAARGL